MSNSIPNRSSHSQSALSMRGDPAQASRFAALRQELEAAGFASRNPRFAQEGWPPGGPSMIGPMWAATHPCDSDCLDRLIRLLLAGGRVEGSALEACLSPQALSTLAESGLVRREGGEWASRAELLPWKDVYIACDRFEKITQDDYVFRPNLSSHFTWSVVDFLRPGRQRILDVGTGSGVAAVLAASAGSQVIAIDVNPRALEFARFNAALNDVAVRFEHCGISSLDADGWGRFDLVMFNMPNLYRAPESLKGVGTVAIQSDRGDELLAQTLGALDRVLSERGIAVLRHHLPSACSDHYDQLLSVHGVADGLQVLWNFRAGAAGLEEGFSVVKRSTDAQADAVSRVDMGYLGLGGDPEAFFARMRDAWLGISGWKHSLAI